MFAPLISDILAQFCPGTDMLIMGDVTYGACCVDDYTARALGCDLLVHYGHSCLVPIDQTGRDGIKTLYVFVTIGVDTEHLIRTVERNFQTGKRIALVGTIQFNGTLHAVVPRLREMGFDPVMPRSAPLSAGEILGCTAPTLDSSSGPGMNTSSKAPTDSTAARTAARSTPGTRDQAHADTILYVGDGRFHLESIMIASPALRNHTYRYDPYTRRLTHETYEHTDMQSLRRSAILQARRSIPTSAHTHKPGHPSLWVLIHGTLGRQGNPPTLSLLSHHLKRLEIPHVTLLLSEISPQKLGGMQRDVAVWVQVACPRLSVDWGYAFGRPLLSAREGLWAVGVGGWSGGGGGGGGGKDGEESVPEWLGDEPGLDGGKEEVGMYPMDYYAKDGLGRVREGDVPDTRAQEVEVK